MWLKKLQHYKHSFVISFLFFPLNELPIQQASTEISFQALLSSPFKIPSFPGKLLRNSFWEETEEINPQPQITTSFFVESAVFENGLCSLTPPVLFFFKSHNFLHEVTFSISVRLSLLLALPLARFSASVALWVSCLLMNEFHSSFFWGLCEKL